MGSELAQIQWNHPRRMGAIDEDEYSRLARLLDYWL
jgi:hypothetical protein